MTKPPLLLLPRLLTAGHPAAWVQSIIAGQPVEQQLASWLKQHPA